MVIVFMLLRVAMLTLDSQCIFFFVYIPTVVMINPLLNMLFYALFIYEIMLLANSLTFGGSFTYNLTLTFLLPLLYLKIH